MSINILFQKANKFFIEKNYIKGLQTLRDIWIKYPKNSRLIDEINRNSKKFKKPLIPSFSDNEIEFFFNSHRDGKTSFVIEKLVEIYKRKNDDILLISLIGTFYGLNKDYDKAIAFQKKAIEKAPFEPSFYINLSQTLKKIDNNRDALSILYFAKILSLKDKLIDVELAKLNSNSKNFSAANLIYTDLIKEKHISKETTYNYCSNLIKWKKESEAILYIEKNYQNDDTLKSLLGLAYFNLNKFDIAKTCFLEAIALNKNNFQAVSNLGNCFQELGLLNQAENCYNNSLKIKPNNQIALNNLAGLSYFRGDIHQAEKIYVLSIEQNEKNFEGKYYLGLCQLAQLNYKEGWQNYAFRWLYKNFDSIKFKSSFLKFSINSQKGNLILWDEQGIGDSILFIRFLKELKPLINNLYISIDKRLHPIIKRLYPDIIFYHKDINLDKHNLYYQLPLGDLGSFFLKDNSYFRKNNKGYITSDINKIRDLETKLNSKYKLKCGISWVSKNKKIGFEKSLTLEALKPVLSIPNITFFDLQYSDTSKEREDFFDDNGIQINKINDLDNFNDINGIISLIQICDFVITVSNSNAHFSGALGKETFLLLPLGKGKLWYWTSVNNKSVWYPSVKVIEQEEIGSWNGAIKKLSRIIKDKSGE